MWGIIYFIELLFYLIVEHFQLNLNAKNLAFFHWECINLMFVSNYKIYLSSIYQTKFSYKYIRSIYLGKFCTSYFLLSRHKFFFVHNITRIFMNVLHHYLMYRRIVMKPNGCRKLCFTIWHKIT